MKDSRYAAVKAVITTGGIKNFKDVFTIIPISVVHKDTNIHYATLHRRIHDVRLLTLENFVKIAALIEIEPEILVSLALADLPKKKGK
ncbi:MAG TPA: hypothetical protein VM802_30930 [Chitinophaga sp.]|uniref:hypothetical protein n=1 Tax=Chitinophaga sp. TaxID=1869181 RepID=UPI002B750640|nr:hypothetical protein [Chitinophaga sp.]HVI49320.1 hypothetical protein [Chitinophaga sp.]